MFLRRYHGEIIFHLFSVIFFDLIYFMLLIMLLIRENIWFCVAAFAVFGYLHLRYFRGFCRSVRWAYVTPHFVFPLLLSLVAFLTYFP